MKKVLSIILALTLMISVFATINVYAEENTDSVTAKFLNCNVAGLPDFGSLIGMEGRDVKSNSKQLGAIFNNSDFDVIATQEDFNYHKTLTREMKNYKYSTNHSGGVPGGDGLNVFTKNIPVYNEMRQEWHSCYGGIAEGDGLTPKGILYTVLDLGNGITVDFYDIHADAFDGGGNALSRSAQYLQLMTLVSEKSEGRPVILTGDFNTSVHLNYGGDNSADERMMYEITTQFGFKDAWIECNNNGDYKNFSEWYQKYPGDYWGIWDSVEKFYYRNGGGIEITAEDFEYFVAANENGDRLSDHNGAVCDFTFTKGADFKEDTRELKAVHRSIFANLISTFRWIGKDLKFVFGDHLDEFLGLIGLKK
ncbi:MAG: hypothetical protein MJ120_06960 [Clostridia bacterium]|nr:hypothetical protein [Clostridia bacterium]